MANQFKWDKPTMTAKELSAILHGQYGPECPTRILVEDDTKPLPYMNALVQCECMRCGKTFSMAPYALTANCMNSSTNASQPLTPLHR